MLTYASLCSPVAIGVNLRHVSGQAGSCLSGLGNRRRLAIATDLPAPIHTFNVYICTATAYRQHTACA